MRQIEDYDEMEAARLWLRETHGIEPEVLELRSRIFTTPKGRKVRVNELFVVTGEPECSPDDPCFAEGCASCASFLEHVSGSGG